MSLKIINIKKKVKKKEKSNIELAIAGNDDAFLKVMKEHKEYIYKLAFSYVKNEVDALEVVDEAVFKAYKNIKKVKEAEYFKSWIGRIVINISLDKLKKKEKLSLINDMESIMGESSSLNIEEKLDIKCALDLINDNYKKALVMKHYDSLSTLEIAEKMNCSISSVKNYLYRGKKALANILREGYLNE